MYQCRKALRLNIAVNCSDTRLNISWMAVELPAVVDTHRCLKQVKITAVKDSVSTQQQTKSAGPSLDSPMKVADILRPLGGMSQTLLFTLLGIHSMK